MDDGWQVNRVRAERNPYAPPSEWSPDTATASRPGRVYTTLNVVYAGLIAAATLVLLVRRPLNLDFAGALVAVCFHAPVACFCMVKWGAAHFLWFSIPYNTLLLLMLALAGLALSTSGEIPWPVLAMIGINLAARLSAAWQLRRIQKP